MINRALSPKEKALLKELEELSVSCKKLCNLLIETKANLNDKEKELNSLQKQISALKSENQHQKEMLQTWQSRLSQVLQDLPEIDK